MKLAGPRTLEYQLIFRMSVGSYQNQTILSCCHMRVMHLIGKWALTPDRDLNHDSRSGSWCTPPSKLVLDVTDEVVEGALDKIWRRSAALDCTWRSITLSCVAASLENPAAIAMQ